MDQPDFENDSYYYFIEPYEFDGKQGYRIRGEPKKKVGYFHCGYSNEEDARTVCSRLASDPNEVAYRVNFSHDGPFRIRDNLERDR